MLDQWFSHHVIANDRRNREQIRAGALSPVDVVNECLNNIAANSELNAFPRGVMNLVSEPAAARFCRRTGGVTARGAHSCFQPVSYIARTRRVKCKPRGRDRIVHSERR